MNKPDKAAIWYAACSLVNAIEARPGMKQDLVDSHGGEDNVTRDIVIPEAEDFELWCCRNIEFSELGGIWCYKLHEKFGVAYLAIDEQSMLEIDMHLAIAMCMRLPVKAKVATRHERKMTEMLKAAGMHVENGLIRRTRHSQLLNLHTHHIVAGRASVYEGRYRFLFRTSDPGQVKCLYFP